MARKSEIKKKILKLCQILIREKKYPSTYVISKLLLADGIETKRDDIAKCKTELVKEGFLEIPKSLMTRCHVSRATKYSGMALEEDIEKLSVIDRALRDYRVASRNLSIRK